MSGINRSRRVYQENAYEFFHDMIEQKAKVECTVFVSADTISLRTKSYADYVMAKSAIQGSTGLKIVHDRVILACNSAPKLP